MSQTPAVQSDLMVYKLAPIHLRFEYLIAMLDYLKMHFVQMLTVLGLPLKLPDL